MDQSDIAKLANLAHLDINDTTAGEVAESINAILGLVDQLQAADTDGVEPMAHPQDAQQRLRRDEVSEGNVREKFQAIAPATEQGLYLVPKVID